MLVGALADAGADQSELTRGLESLQTGATVRFERVMRRGIGANKFHVDVLEAKAHRHLSGIVKMINAAALPDEVKRRAVLVFNRLAESEAAVHGVSIEKVHFHEVGAVDSIIDIAGACFAFHLLGAEKIFCSPINVGSGTVETEHGTLPVPAPATASLLRGKPVYSRGPAVELTTPTGAAVITALAEDFGAMPAMRIDRIGYGAGDKDFPGQANVLRVLVGQSSAATESTTVTVIEANIDDTTPQVIGYALERMMEAGALDASVQALGMKKGRPGSLVQAIVKPDDREKIAAILFSETSTLGVRTYTAERLVDARELIEVSTQFGSVRVKVSQSGNIAPEYEDCRALALATGAPLKNVLAEAAYEYQKSIR